MINKIVSFLEENVEKIVLVVVGLVCLWLLVTRVVFSPNRMPYDNKSFSPGAIDDYVSKQAELLKHTLGQPPEPPAPYEPNLPRFTALLDLAVRNIDARAYLPQPYNSSARPRIEGAYNLPDIGDVNGVAIEHIRTVAYEPVEGIASQSSYAQAGYEPNDIDLVTVEGNFDVAGLYRRFLDCFAGDDLPVERRDPCLARPVFASVQLQRQELNADGSWSNWQTVPRLKIDPLKKLLEGIEDADKLPARSIKVRIRQFDSQEVMMGLLQPTTYQIALAREDWFPPSLHKKFVKLREEQQMEEKRKLLEQEKTARDVKLQEERRARTEDTRLGQGGLGGGSRGTDVTGGRDTRSRTDRSDRLADRGTATGSSRLRDSGRLTDSGRSTDSGRLRDSGRSRDELAIEKDRLAKERDILTRQPMDILNDEFNRILITGRTDLSRMRQSLVFWAHDDSAEPKKSYRYRIRFGVFNPVAGASEDSSAGKSRMQDNILWSEFSSPTETVNISGNLYLFAKDLQEAAKIVTVQVSKYKMGRWYSQDFAVRQGESIGKPVESSPVEVRPTERLPGGPPPGTGPPTLPYPTGPEAAILPETIDYSTGAVLVDVMAVNDWSGGKNMLARHYFDMLYSFDGADIEHTPINMKYWAADARAAYSEIQNLQKQPPEPLRPWGAKATGLRQTTPESGYYERYGGGRDELMMKEMMREKTIMEERRRGY